MPQIALLTSAPRWPLARQTSQNALRWGECSFTINPTGGRFDGCVAYDTVLADVTLDCPGDRTFLITGEPPSIKRYNERFARQFSAVVTCDADLPHRRVILSAQGYPWMAGVNKNAADLGSAAKGFDAYLAEPPPEKPGLLSVMVSDKTITPAHRHRQAFVAALTKHFGKDLAVFGRGVRDIGDKAEALSPFRYHLALENSAYFHYWTEKLADPFLCWSYPLYWGCPNAEAYFPEGSFTRINIYDADATIATIEGIIRADTYATALPAVTEARRRVLLEYNLFAIAARLCTPLSALPPRPIRLRPEQVFRDHWTRKLRHRAKRVLPRRWRKKKAVPLGAPPE